MPISYKENPTQFLCDSGILFEINRTIMHPLGLALVVVTDLEKSTEEDEAIIRIWDRPKAEEGYEFDPEIFAEGMSKITATRTANLKQMERRKELLGYVVQGEPLCRPKSKEEEYDDWGNLDGS